MSDKFKKVILKTAADILGDIFVWALIATVILIIGHLIGFLNLAALIWKIEALKVESMGGMRLVYVMALYLWGFIAFYSLFIAIIYALTGKEPSSIQKNN